MTEKIIVRTREKTFFIGSNDIRYCKAAGSYSVIFLTNQEEIIASINLLNLYERMECLESILRVSQSFLVNLICIKCINHSTKEIELHDNTLIPYTIPIRELESELISSLNRSKVKLNNR